MTDKVKGGIIFVNPKSANSKHRLPNSILQIAASIHSVFNYVFVDGNIEKNPLNVIIKYLESGKYSFLAVTVMPGPQTKQAIPFTKIVKQKFPDLITI
ncbi:MAG: hypothetical protein JXR51_12215 [Bacteroidales bacterium]|nr:hypothetical protein [Bacteroidales bacterium]MBN2757935.1 hypothetical protein [Bacteroidales bacterium]